MKVSRHIWLLLLLPFLMVGCTRGDRTLDYRRNLRNVILIAIDTLAAQHLGFMGYERNTSPFLDEFSRRCVVFDRAYTPKALTLPAFASLLSGLHVVTHNVQGNGRTLPEELHLLAEDFSDMGFFTVGVPAAQVIGARYGISRGFTCYYTCWAYEIPASGIVGTVERFFESEPSSGRPGFVGLSQPLFLFIHFFDPHTDYTPDPQILSEFADPDYAGPVDGRIGLLGQFNEHEVELDEADLRHVRDLYDAEIRTLDDHLRELFDIFERVGLMENALIAFTADHGENLGEHHYITHGHPYEPALHVPLMFHFPHDLAAGMRIDALVELTDTVPTIMDLLDVPIPEGIDGRSLLPLIEQAEEADAAGRQFLLASGGFNKAGKRTYGLFDGTHRLIKDIRWSDVSLLYDITADPLETHDIAGENPELVEYLESVVTLMSEGEQPSEAFEMDPETEEMLRSLGYLH